MAFFEPRIHKTLVIYWPTGLPDCTVDKTPNVGCYASGFVGYKLRVLWHSIVPNCRIGYIWDRNVVKGFRKGLYNGR